MVSISTVNRLDFINIALLVVSCILAFIIPFELFLFAYAILGPLHYLTEISWLHDKNYYTTGKKDFILLLIISLVLTVIFLVGRNRPGLLAGYVDDQDILNLTGTLTFIAFGSALFFAFIKNTYIKVIGILGIVLMTVISKYLIVFFTLFLPTLVHVFLFTSIFMLYGALKAKSKPGYLTVILHLLCPFLLFFLFPNQNFSGNRGMQMYINSDLSVINKYVFINFFQSSEPGKITSENLVNMVFTTKTGIAIMRFIAFAYMYHFLNWFSKTEIIRWHKVPKIRFILVVIGWIISVALYSINYSIGLQWLYLLSFMHVFLEFPLNFVSFAGIFSELKIRIFQPALPQMSKSQLRKSKSN